MAVRQARDAFGQVHRAPIEHDLARHDPTHVEEVVHQTGHVQRLPPDDVAGAYGAGLPKVGQAKHLHRAPNRAERIAKLVRQHREKLVLGPALALHLRNRAHVGDDQVRYSTSSTRDLADRHVDIERRPGAVTRGACGACLHHRPIIAISAARSPSSMN